MLEVRDEILLETTVQGHIRHLDAERQRLNRRLGDLNRNRASIAATGLAALDDNAQAALAWLDGQGISQVGHYPAYLAEIVPDATAARRCLETDPARFGGLQVYSGEVLKRIEALPPDGLELRRPVQVSLARVEPGEPPTDALVLNAPFDAAYNREAASAYLARLDRQCADLERQIDEREQALSDARAQSHKLDDYLKEFGVGGLAKLRRGRDELNEKIARLNAELIDSQGRMEAIKRERENLAKEREQLRESVRGVRDLLKSVNRIKETIATGKVAR